jgi:hypothetical protein
MKSILVTALIAVVAVALVKKFGPSIPIIGTYLS